MRFHPSALAVLAALAAEVASQTSWTWRNPVPTGNTLGAAAWDGNRFVAVGDAGTVLTSPDGGSWTQRNSAAEGSLRESYLYGLTWTGTQFIAVGLIDPLNSQGIILTSPDGEAWTVRSQGECKALYSVTGSGTRFVAVGANGICTSDDGLAWTSRPAPLSIALSDIAWTGSLWVAVGGLGIALTSPDGISWTTHSTRAGFMLRSIAWNGGRLAAVGEEGGVITSEDGITWTQRASGTTSHLMSVAWTGSRFVAVGRDVILVSPDGIAWSKQIMPASVDLLSVAGGGDRTVAVGSRGSGFFSEDGQTWQAAGKSIGDAFTAVAWTGSRLVAVGVTPGLLGSVYASSEGINWTEVGIAPNRLFAVSHGGTRTLAVGDAGTVVSSDGASWTIRNTRSRIDLQYVVWTGSRWVAGGRSDTVLVSPDGATWTSHAMGSTNGYPLAAVWAGNQVVAVGTGGLIQTSPDGISWTQRDPGTRQTLYGVAWTGKTLVAVGASDTVLLSPDGSQWTKRGLGFGRWPTSVTWTGSRLIAVGSSGTIVSSADGEAWVAHDSRTQEPLLGVAWTGSNYVAVGGHVILTSPVDPAISVLPRQAGLARLSLRWAGNRLQVSLPGVPGGFDLALYGHAGQRLLTARGSAGRSDAVLSLGSLSAGNYLLEARAGSLRLSRPILLTP